MCLEAQDISKTLGGTWEGKPTRKILQGLHLSVKPGETLGITGPSGAGKTTLGLILTGILRPDSGRVFFQGTDFWATKGKDRKAVQKRIQMVFQHPETTFDPRWTLGKSLEEPFRLQGIRPVADLLIQCLDTVGVPSSVLTRKPSQLSGGELQRIALARIMVLNPSVVVLDEPTAMLDVLTQARIMDLLARIQRKTGMSYVLISHDEALVQSVCTTRFRLENSHLIGVSGPAPG